jgi:uncharacterized protein (DUF1697 family)
MATHILLLRGVNLGNHNKLNMQKLCLAMTKNGFDGVRYYLQSGNVLVKSRKKSATLEVELTQLIKKTFNMDVPVIAFDKKTFTEGLKKFPFTDVTKDWQELSYFTFLAEKPDEEKLAAFLAEEKAEEKIVFHEQLAYLFLPKKYHEAKINNNYIEKKLGITCSTRNWNTVNRIKLMFEDK